MVINSNMKLSREETQAIIDAGKKQGLNGQDVFNSLIKKGYQPEGYTPPPKQTQSIIQPVKEAGGDILGIGKDIIKSSSKRAENIQEAQDAMARGEQGFLQTTGQTFGQLAGAGADAIGATFKGATNLLLSDKTEKQITAGLGEFAGEVMKDPGVQKLVKWYDNLSPEQQRNLDAVGGVVFLVSEFTGLGAAKKASQPIKRGISEIVDTTSDVLQQGAKTFGDTVETGAKTVSSGMASGSGVIQTGQELLERVPRAIRRGKEQIAEAGIRAEKIKTATPEVATAIKSNLDERIINTVTEADDVTKKAYRQVLDIAEESPKTIGTKKQPTIVGGELATKQFDLINKQKKSVGKQLGDLTKSLSKTEKVPMQESYSIIDDTLANTGIVPQYTKKGVKLDFTGSKYTPAERTKIQELYNLATEGGDKLTPLQIREKDQLFSKLKREANFEGIGNIIIETQDGNRSLFDVFRDVYSSKLDTISPELRDLNSQYRKLSNITDDIEDSIFKTPNFNITKSTDPAEFAKVNMRRIFGESQSSPVFEAVADNMDMLARELGYTGATPKQVAEFAQELRKLFPETTPKTGFQGGIKAGLSDIIETVSKAGTPDIEDQRKALRLLLSPKQK
jgi:hypothetical protein